MATAQSLKQALEKSLQHSFGNTKLGLNLVNETSKMIYDIPESTRAIFHDRRELIMSSDKTSYAPGEVIQIKVSSPQDLLDCQNSYIKFKLKLGAAGDRLCGPVTQLIRKIKIYCSSGTIEELDFANMAYKLVHEAGSSSTWLETHGQAIGYYPGYRNEVASDRSVISNGVTGASVSVRDTRYVAAQTDLKTPANSSVLLGNIWDSTNIAIGTARTYMLPLHVSGFLSQSKLIPLQLFSDLTIEITLANKNAALCHYTGTAAGDYQISKVKYVAEVVRVNDIWSAQLQLASEEKDPRLQLKMVFPSWAYQGFSSAASGGTTSQDLTIQPNYFDVRGIYAMARPTSTIEGDGTAYNFMTRYDDTAITSYNWQVGQNYYPSQNVEDQLHMYAEALESFNRLKHVDNACLSYNDYLNYCHFIGLNLEVDADSNITGQPIGPSNPAILHLQAATFGVNTSWHVFILHTRMLIIEAGGKVVINV